MCLGFATNAGINRISAADGTQSMQYLPESAGAAYCLSYHDGHLYAGTISRPGQVFKLDTAAWGSTAAVIGNVTFAAGHDVVLGLEIDSAGSFAYASLNSGHVEALSLASFAATGSAVRLTSTFSLATHFLIQL